LGAQGPGGRRRDEQPGLGQSAAGAAVLPPRLPHRARDALVPACGGDGARRPRPARARAPARGAAGRGRRSGRARGAAALLHDHALRPGRRRHRTRARAAAPRGGTGVTGGRMRPRLGLRERFAVLAVVVLACVLGMVALVWDRQDAMHRDAQELSLQAIREFSSSRLLSHGRAATLELADTLVNPLYYFDLDAIGAAARGTLRQPDVSYVIVYDNEGQVIHDGSPDISTYGQAMSDPFAYVVLDLDDAHVQSNDALLDIAAPIRIGDQRLGGVRVDYSLATVKAEEARVGGIMATRLDAIGRSQLFWLGLLATGMVALLVAIGVVLQRALVSPVRQLADAARQIEAGTLDAEVSATGRKDEVGDLMRAFAHMRDSLVRHDRDIRRMAYTDALTGLSNRLAFRELLDQRLAQGHGLAQQLALLFADIDDFKRVNDTIGHDAGDEVLMQFSG